MWTESSVLTPPAPFPMPHSSKTPTTVRFVILACVVAVLSVGACVEGPNDGNGSSGGGGGDGQGPATLSFTMQAY